MIKRPEASPSELCSWDHLPPEVKVDSRAWFDSFRHGAELSARESMQKFISRMAVVHPDSQATMLAYQVAILLDTGYRHRALLLLCKSGADVTCVDTATDATMLHHAARNGHAALAELLLRLRETDVNAVCRAGGSALHIAAQLDHATVVTSLLRVPGICVNANGSRAKSRGRSADRPSQDSDTPLRRAVAHGSHNALEALISHPLLQMYCDFGEGQVLYRLTRKLFREGKSECAERCAAVLAQHGWGPSFDQGTSWTLPPMGLGLQRAPCNDVPASYLDGIPAEQSKPDLSSDCLAELQAAAERVAEQVLCEDESVPAKDNSLRISCQTNARHDAYPSHPHPLNNLGAHEDAPDFIKTKRGKRAGRARLLQYKKKKQEEKERKRAAAAAAGGSGFALEVAQQDTGFNPALECPSYAELTMSHKNTGAVTFAQSHLMLEDCLDRHHRQDNVQGDQQIRYNNGYLGLLEEPVIQGVIGQISLDRLTLYSK